MKKTVVLVGMLVLVCGVLFAQTASDFAMESVTYRGIFSSWQSFADYAESNVDQTINFYINTGDRLEATYITDRSSMEIELVRKGVQQTQARSSSGDGWSIMLTYRGTSSWFYKIFIYWQGNSYKYYLVRFNTY